MDKNFKALELDKILQELSDLTVSDDAKKMALNLEVKTNLDDVEHVMDETVCAYSLLVRYSAPSFAHIKDMSRQLKMAHAGAMLGTNELIDIGNLLHSFSRLVVWYNSCEEKEKALDGYFNSIYQNKYFEDKIFSIILGKDEIADRASSTLYEIRRKIRAKSNNVREKLDDMIHSVYYQKFLQDPIVTQRNGRFVLPVKAEYRSEVEGLIHDTSSSGATVFIEPTAVVQANNEIKILENEEDEEIRRILLELSSEAASFSENINSSYNAAIYLDLIFAKAELALKMKATRPILNSNCIVDLKNARHPLINPDSVVPIDISIGEDFDTLVITGPNTGGKTVALKTLGLITLMAMCGMMVPTAEETKICVFSKVLSDIGDEQSIQQNLSTFSAHMVNIIDILTVVDDRSLVLLDELGAGTDPTEGAALAVSIIEKLRMSGARIVATTHYTDLKVYALETEGVRNACCEFDINTLMPTYKLLMGIPGKSNAFAISLRLGMENDVVEHAKELLSSNNRSLEKAIEMLEQDRIKLKEALVKAEQESKNADLMKRRAQSQKDKIMSSEESELKRAHQEAEKIINDAKTKARSFLLELDKIKKEQNASDTVKRARKAVQNSIGKLEDSIDISTSASNITDENIPITDVKAGDKVYINNIGEGEVLEFNGDSDILVQSGQLKIRVKKQDLYQSKKKKTQTSPNYKLTRSSTRTNGSVSTQLDLRGKTVEEALNELDSFIYNSVINNISNITIIHGKGTGALRNAVHKMLKSHQAVEQFRLGEYGEGDTGITIVKLK